MDDFRITFFQPSGILKTGNCDCYFHPHTPIFSHIFLENASIPNEKATKNRIPWIFPHFPQECNSQDVDDFFEKKSGKKKFHPRSSTAFSTRERQIKDPE